MTRRYLSTGSPIEAAAGYSRAVIDDDWVFVAGTTGYDYTTMTMPDGVAVQTENALATIETTLQKAGASMADVVRVRYYVAERADVDAVIAIVGRTFGEIRPAATMVLCALIDPAMRIEIEVTARRRDHQDT